MANEELKEELLKLKNENETTEEKYKLKEQIKEEKKKKLLNNPVFRYLKKLVG